MPDAQGYIWRGEYGYDDPVLACQQNAAKFGGNVNVCGQGPEGGTWSWKGPGGSTSVATLPVDPLLLVNANGGADIKVPCSVAAAACALLSGQLRASCFAAAGCVDPSAGMNPLTNLPTGTTGCPPTYVLQNGKCVKAGIDQWIPGPIGTLGDYGPAVIGAFGKPALTPKQIGQIKRKDGSTHPILRCPPGSVLGRDDLCYNKGSITNKERAHPKGHRPLLTGGDMQALSKAKALTKKLRKLANHFAPVHHRAPRAPKKK